MTFWFSGLVFGPLLFFWSGFPTAFLFFCAVFFSFGGKGCEKGGSRGSPPGKPLNHYDFQTKASIIIIKPTEFMRLG